MSRVARFVLPVVLAGLFAACGQSKKPQPDALGVSDARGGEADGGTVEGTGAVDGRWDTRLIETVTDAVTVPVDAPQAGMADGPLGPDAAGADGRGDATVSNARDALDAAAGKADADVVDANLGRDLAGPQPSVCHGRRTNLTEDPMNCGACGIVCASTCSEGVCADACQPPLMSAGDGVCADPRSDPRNCGRTVNSNGTVCKTNQLCKGGVCMDVCKSGELQCAGACVVPARDSKNCGACGLACPTGTGCMSGVCLPCKTLLPLLPIVSVSQQPITGVLTADLNGDGKLDLVTWGRDIGTFLGNGDGTFGIERVAIGNYPRALAAGDMDGDGKVDLVAASEKGDALVVWPGLGDGSFGPARSLAVSATGKPLIVDLNADGKWDVAILGADKSVKVVLGAASVDLSPATSYALEISASWMAEGDLDGDGKLDLVVAGAANGDVYAVYALYGVGDGTFKAPQKLLNKVSISDLAVGDLDNDGKAEIVLDAENQVWVVRRSSSGSYPVDRWGTSVSGAWGPLFLADVNGDDRLDVVVGSAPSGSNLQVLLSSSYGRGLAAPRSVTVGDLDAMALGDLNGDGRLDAVIASQSAKTLSILPGQGQGTFLGPAPQGKGVVLDGMHVTDMEQDGQLDILGHKRGSKLISIFRGSYGWGMEEMWDVPAEAGAVFGVADLNGDGKSDIVIGSEKSESMFVLMTGAGGYSRTTVSLDTAMNAMVLGDWNGDGKIDIAAATQSASDVTVALGKGGASLNTPVHYPVPSGPVQIFAVDIDGDATKDLLVAGSGSVSYLASKGDGTFAAAKKIGTAGGWVEVGDFDENGILDLAVLGYRDSVSYNSAVGVLLGTGGGAFAEPKTYPYAGSASDISVGDINGDGHMDLMIPGDTMLFRLGRGDGTFGPVVASYPLSRDARLYDMDHDGQAEVILSDNSGFSVLQGIKDCAASH